MIRRAHEAGETIAARREHDAIDVDGIEGCVLRIDDEEIEVAVAQDLRNLMRGAFDERAQHHFAGARPLSERFRHGSTLEQQQNHRNVAGASRLRLDQCETARLLCLAMQTIVSVVGTNLGAEEPASAEGGLESVDLVLRLMELLANSPAPRRLTEIATELGISKARAHRHLRALLHHGYVRQHADTERYEIGVKVLVLGEAVRDRFDVLTAMRPQMLRLRESTSQTVTASALVDDAVVVLELLQGRTLIEFGVRPGAALDMHASAHGLVALAFGPPRLRDKALTTPLRAWTRATVTKPKELSVAIEKVRRQGWATAPDQVMPGVNALAAPVFDHRGAWCGTLALVGSTQFIPGRPPKLLVEQVTTAAAEVSRSMGWKAKAA